MRRSGLVLCMVAIAACRSRSDEAVRDAGPGPTMPAGMLVPSPTAEGGAAEPASLRVARNVRSGPWVELQAARPGDAPTRKDFERWRADSRFVSVEAMTLMHEPFARALPGFDLFLPRLFGPDALAKLATELDAFAKRTNGPISEAALELSDLAKETGASGKSLWILAP